ncbi:hypothetical protein ABTP95_20265, partial [Acinetobacter baumannii]
DRNSIFEIFRWSSIDRQLQRLITALDSTASAFTDLLVNCWRSLADHRYGPRDALAMNERSGELTPAASRLQGDATV